MARGGWWTAAVCSLATAGGLVGCGQGTTVPPLDGGLSLIPVDVETVAPTRVRAGQVLDVTCLLVDAQGETFSAPEGVEPTLRFVPAASVSRGEDGGWMAVRAGDVEVACTFTALRLTDDTPAVVEIVPGDPARVVTTIQPDSITAGETATAGCEVYDAHGNFIDLPAPEVRAEPSDGANIFEGSTGTFERAGRFDVGCVVPGASVQPASLEVLPALPASLVIARVPDQPVYAIGQVIEIQRLVADRFGNPITDVMVSVVSAPFGPTLGQELGDGRFRYLRDGRYLLTATVLPPTHDDVPLRAEVEVLVDGNGPAIGCDAPLDGAILDQAPGSTLTFRGSVGDLTGVTEARVNGRVVAVASDGSFSAPLTTRYGINFVDLAAVDGVGRESSRTCAFLVANVWAPDSAAAADMISLRLRQPAFDDTVRTGPINSLADVLHTVLNSRGLRDALHTSLLASNPLKPSSCDQTVLGVCVLRSEVIYRDLQINGPNGTDLTLVDGGLRSRVRIQNLRVNVRVRGQVAGIPYDTTGWVTFSTADVAATFDTSLSAGRPRVTVRPGSVSVTMGTISTSFAGLDGAIINIVVSLFNGTVRNLIADLLRDWVVSNFDSVLDGVLGGLDIDSLGTAFLVPRLDAGSLRLSFNVNFSSLGTTSTRMLFGMGARFFAPPAHARRTLGAPVRSASRLLDVSGTQSTALGVHEALLTQALHALWRGGFFDATLDDSTLGGGLPSGVSATIATGLPPVAEIRADGRTELSLGAMTVDLTYPDLFAEPIRVTLGARASLATRLVGDDLSFSDPRIDELNFSTDLTSLDMRTRATIAGFLTRLLERVALSALEDALPALPIPSFELPASLATFGLPAGARLGIVSPTLANERPHYVLRGSFAVR